MGETPERARERLGGGGGRREATVGRRAGSAQDGPEVWVEAETPERPRGGVRAAGVPAPARRRARLPAEVGRELARAADGGAGGRLEPLLAEAARAYDHDRYQDAQRILASVVRRAPEAAAVRELYGLCFYRRGRWAEAIRQLEAAHRLSGSLDQHPVLADCYRAMGRGRDVRRLWDELRAASPSAELVAEGRIVMAGSLADSGDLAGAVALLERSLRPARPTRDHHLRQWYALADLYERAGDVARARALFSRVLASDPEVADTAERLAALG